jgi:hypothetical protein
VILEFPELNSCPFHRDVQSGAYLAEHAQEFA